MKPLLFQLVYQAASTVLLLFYVNNINWEKDYYLGRKQRIMNNVLSREDNELEKDVFGTANSSYNNIKAAKNEQRTT